MLHYGCNGSSTATGNVYRMFFDAALSLSAALPDLSKVIRHVPSDHYAPIIKSQRMFVSNRISALLVSHNFYSSSI